MYSTVCPCQQIKIFRSVSRHIADTLQSQIRLYRIQLCLRLSDMWDKKKKNIKVSFFIQSNKNVIIHDQSFMLRWRMYYSAVLLCFCLQRQMLDWSGCLGFLTFLVSSRVAVFSWGAALCLSALLMFCCGLQWFLFSACLVAQCVNLNTERVCELFSCYFSVSSPDFGADDDDMKTCLLG